MSSKTKDAATMPDRAVFWQQEYEKRGLMVESMMSLLNKYGSTLELSGLYREFLLTLMGHYLTAGACYFTHDEQAAELKPALSYGPLGVERLSPISCKAGLYQYLQDHANPAELAAIPKAFTHDAALSALQGEMSLMASVQQEKRLLGVVFLGPKISSEAYSDFDKEVLVTLCSISAITFNNAALYDNVKMSVREIQRLLDVRTEMISRISHEFRTPLTIIKAGLSAIQVSEESKAIFEAIPLSVERLHMLIESLLKLNTEEPAGGVSARSKVNPARCMYEYIGTVVETMRDKNLTFELKGLAEGSAVALRIASAEYNTVLETLLQNAIKYSNPSSKIVVAFETALREPDATLDGVIIREWKDQLYRTLKEYKSLASESGADTSVDLTSLVAESEFEIMGTYAGPYFIVRVTDSGIGIPQNEIPFLGEPFRQASNSPDQGVSGRALGLAVARKIIADRHGHLCCKSTVGVGTTFTVFLPLDTTARHE